MNKLPENINFAHDIFFNKEDLVKLIETAANWMDENPEFEPKFSMIANVLLNDNDETRDMTQKMYELSGVEGDQGSFAPDMLFYHYAVAVANIKNKGFDGYVKLKMDSEQESP